MGLQTATNNALRDAAGNLIVLAGNLTTTGAFDITLTATADSVATLPAGTTTLVDDAVTALTALASVGTITVGEWQATVIAPAFGGTGVNNGTSEITLGGNLSTVGAYNLVINLTADSNVNMPASGTLATTSQTSGVLPLTDVTGTTQALLTNNAYVANNAGVASMTLPATAAFGTQIEVRNIQGGFTVVQNALQSIIVGNVQTTVGAGGSVSSTALGDGLLMTCVVANTTWLASALQGSLSVV